MHDAFECVAILERLPLGIDCIASSGDCLLVGTNKGHLLIYNIREDPKSHQFEVELMQSNKAFGKKPITQLVIVESQGIIISLSDGIISVHDFSTYSLKQQFPNSKGVLHFSVDTSPQKDNVPIRLCAVTRRKMQLFGWKNGEFGKLYEDTSYPETPKIALWAGQFICIAMKKDYQLVNCKTGDILTLFDTGKGKSEPLVVRIITGELAVCRDEVTIFLSINDKGEHQQRHAVTWSDTPIGLEFVDPYIIAILPKHIEICSRYPQSVIQRIDTTGARKIIKGPHCYASSVNCVWRLVPIPFPQQIEQLMRDKNYEMALEVANLLKDVEFRKKKTLHIKELYAFELFCSKKFDHALKLFKEVEATPTYVIGLFPDLLPEQYRKQIRYPSTLPKLKQGDLQNGYHCLTEYLTRIRNKSLSNQNNSEITGTPNEGKLLLQIIDTSLLKCYLQTNENMIAPLLRLKDNNCHVDECERVLLDAKKINELVLLYQSKGIHKKALKLMLRKSDVPNSALDGPSKTVTYLQRLGPENMDLITDYSRWVLKKFPNEGLKIFTADMPEVESLPRDEILTHLEKFAPQLVTQYLEHIIFDWKESQADFHNKLIIRYKDQILPLLRDYMVSLPQGEPRKKAGKEIGDLGDLRTKLLFFLESSSNYQPYKLLRFFPQDSLFEERALLLGRAGRHDEALAIYIYILNDAKMAEKYCRRQYEQNKDENRNVYLTLIKLYLKPQDLPSLSLPHSKLSDCEIKPKVDAGLAVLNEYSDKIDIVQAIELLPPITEVKDIKISLMRVLQDKMQHQRKNMVLKSLLYAEHLQVYEQRVFYQSKKCVITEERACLVCHKRIGTSAFAMYPNGVIVHYYCCKDRRVCPIQPGEE